MKSIFTICMLFLGVTTSFAQAFLNGSFEITTAPVSCNYNLPNGTFNGYMPNVNAYGTGNEVDIMVAGCYNPGPAPQGTFFIGIAGAIDEIAMTLSTPLVAGNSYTIAFSSYAEMSFRPQGNVEIGASTSNSAFGTLIHTATTVPSTWVGHSFTFVAPNNATHITARNVSTTVYWNHVDNFRFTTPLPITWSKFQAQVIGGNAVKTEWETLNETNNAYFVVERSKEGSQWEELSRLNSAGNTTTPNAYSYIDQTPYQGNAYYRIKQVSVDGQSSYSEIQNVWIENTNVPFVQVYPNPAQQEIMLEGTSAELTQLKIYTLLGQDVSAALKVTNNQGARIQLDISALSSGTYYLKTPHTTHKIVKF